MSTHTLLGPQMTTISSCQFVPLQAEHLAWVVEQEARLHFSPWSLGNFSDSMAAGYDCWLMVNGEVWLGYAIVLRVLDEAHLLNISMSPEHQRQGHARSFLNFLGQDAVRQGCTAMYLEVRESNVGARALYNAMGFTQIGERKRYYPAANSGRENAVVMKWELL